MKNCTVGEGGRSVLGRGRGAEGREELGKCSLVERREGQCGKRGERRRRRRRNEQFFPLLAMPIVPFSKTVFNPSFSSPKLPPSTPTSSVTTKGREYAK